MALIVNSNKGSIMLYQDDSLITSISHGQYRIASSFPNHLRIYLIADQRVYWDLPIPAKFNGVEFSDAKELTEKLSSFSAGGGSGEGATLDQIYTQLQDKTIWKGSMKAFNDIEKKDEKTLYFITG